MNPFKTVWRMGFRPFFLATGISAAVMILLWVSAWSTGEYRDWSSGHPMIWHGHEMVFGFSLAAVVGFLLTATQNWTGVRGVHGEPLVILTLVWVSARLAPFLTGGNTGIQGVLDILFICYALFLLRPYLVIADQKRNRIFLVILGLLGCADVMIHLGILLERPVLSHRAIGFSVDIILVVIGIIAGRIIPFFTSRAISGAQVRPRPIIEKLSMISLFLFAATDFFPSDNLKGVVGIAAGLVHLVRFSTWDFARSWKVPILSVLYAGYLWIILGLFSYGISLVHPLIPTIPLHMITVGGIGLMILGMMPRVSSGHTGRPIRSEVSMIVAWIFIFLAAVFRTIVPVFAVGNYQMWVKISGHLWAMGFLLFLLKFSSVLISPRVDGKDG